MGALGTEVIDARRRGPLRRWSLAAVRPKWSRDPIQNQQTESIAALPTTLFLGI